MLTTKIIKHKSGFIILTLILMYSILLTSCKNSRYLNSKVTFICKMNGQKMLANTISIDVYDETQKLVCQIKTDYDGEATEYMTTEKQYRIEAYGTDNQQHEIKGAINFYLDSDNEYEFIEIPMKYVSSQY